MLQGKWMLQGQDEGRTIARLAVEVKLKRSVRSMVFEPFIEVRRGIWCLSPSSR